jgi:hypothetical protein
VASAIDLLTILKNDGKAGPGRSNLAPYSIGDEAGFPATHTNLGYLLGGDHTWWNRRKINQDREMRKYRSLWRVSSQNHYI